tara:strand:+ start:541 stop:1062 length:522 start_codon:yes stop_codon:yes gene_type:complete
MEKEKLSQLNNAQKKLNRLQGQEVFRIVKSMPKWFWVMFLITTVTMLNTLRLHYVMKDLVKAEHQKTEFNRQLAAKYNKDRDEREAGLREHIEHLNEVIEKKTNKTAGMRAAIQRKDATIADLVSQSNLYLESKVAMNYKNSRPSEMRTNYEVLRNRGWNLGNIDSQDLVNLK